MLESLFSPVYATWGVGGIIVLAILGMVATAAVVSPSATSALCVRSGANPRTRGEVGLDTL